MLKYKILASDLDGTLLDSNGNLSAENLRAIRELSARGAYFVPASGRSLAEIPAVLKNEDSIRYYIHSSGAGLYDKLTGENVSFGFPHELSKKLFELLFSFDCYVTVRRDGRMLADADKLDDAAMKYYNVWAPHEYLLRTAGEGVPGFKQAMLAADDVDMISLFFHSNEDLQATRRILCEYEDLNVASACNFNVELTYSKAGKGNTLLALAEKLSVNANDTVAIGDSENDLPMLLAAGLGLATENATDQLKQYADATVCSNDEHTVLFVLENYFSDTPDQSHT